MRGVNVAFRLSALFGSENRVGFGGVRILTLAIARNGN
jgi:hypothetical protein